MEDTLEKRESDFLNELRKHENKWVAIYGEDESETIVGSGADAVEAAKEARENGVDDFSLFYVRPFETGYLPFRSLR